MGKLEQLLWLGLIYVIGYIISLYLLKTYGKAWGVDDYDKPKTYVNMDDFSSNAQAYTSWSLGWFVLGPMALIFWLGGQLVKLTKNYLNK